MKNQATVPSFESQLVRYLEQQFFKGDTKRFAEHVNCTESQIKSWRDGKQKPQKQTIKWMLSASFAPEFRIACEFEPVHLISVKEITPELKRALKTHGGKAGVYAFYDSMCNVIYIGKASKSLAVEMCQQLKGSLGVVFPKAVSDAPSKRWQATSFVSAYEIPAVEHMDYQKHVESLVLRISKPIGNKALGNLQRSTPPKVT